MKKMLLLLGADKDIILLFVLATLLYLASRDIAQLRLFTYLDDWTLFLFYKWKKNKGRRRAV